MNEILISYAADGAATAEALGALLKSAKNTVWLCRQDAPETHTGNLHERLETSVHAVFVITPGWNAVCWSVIEDYIANALGSPAAFLAKLVLVDVSNGAVPALLRPLTKAGLSFNAAQALDYFAIGKRTSDSRSRPGGAQDTADCRLAQPFPLREVFVTGHPGSGKSAFCALVKSRLGRLCLPVAKIDAYSYLQVMFRIDQLKRDASRFAPDDLYEFVIKNPCVFDESLSLVQRRLLAQNTVASGVSIVELTMSESDSLTDLIESHPRAMIVHIDAPLAACRNRNAARGVSLERRLRIAACATEAYDADSDVHFVPPRYYDPYVENPSKWDVGAAMLVKRFGDRYYRIDNAHGGLRKYTASCEAFIDTMIMVRLPDVNDPLTVCLGKNRGQGE